MKSGTFTSLLALALAPSAFGWDWVDAPKKTVYYTPGVSIGVLYIITDLAYATGQSVEVVSGAPPTGIAWAKFGSCSSAKLCSAYTGTPSGNTVATVVLRAVNGAETRDLTIEFRPAFSISGTASAAVVSASHSSTFTLVGGTLPSAWNAPTGTLPPGLTFDTSSGILSGTPTASGTYSFTLSATDNTPTTATKAVSLTVYAALDVSTSTLSATTVGATFSQSLASTGGTTPRTWSISAGSLPAGISLNASTGALTGTAASAGTANFTAQVACCTTATAAKSLSILVNPAPSITTTTLPAASPGVAYSQTLAATGGTGTLTWSVSSGALPAGLSLSSTGVVSGTPSASGPFSFTARVQDSVNIAATQALSITVNNLPSITTSSLPALTVGQSVSTTLAATSGTSPYTWSISSGALPAGISLNSATGALTGTPTTAAVATFTAKVTDSGSQEGTANFTWTVNAAPSITTTTLSPTTVSIAYSTSLAAIGGTGTLAWSVSAGALPAGITLNSATGALSGTATSAGTVNFTVQVSDANSVSATQALSIAVSALPAITTTTLPSATRSQSYSQTLTATGGTGSLTWTHANGTLPGGVTFSPSGVLSGTPASAGTFNFMVRVADTLNGAAVQSLSLLVLDPPSVTTSSLPALTSGQTVSTSLAATGGTSPYTWSIASGALPAGLSLNPSTGAITGTVTSSGPATFTAQVTDSASLSATANLTWTVNAAPGITTTTLSATTVSAAYSASLAATGGTGALIWSVASGALPAGLSLNGATGALTGTSTTAGTASFTVQATDINSVQATQALSLIVNAQPAITTTTLPDGTVSGPYSQSLASTGGTGAHSWTVSAGALPAGLTLSSAGLISGTPTSAGTANFTARVEDGLSVANTRALTLRVLSLPVITTSTLAAVTVGQSVSTTLAASSGTTPYIWSISSGALPAGISLNSATGALTGTPTTPGPATFTARLTDSASQETTANFTWVVNAAPAITTTTLSPTTVTATYSAAVASTGGTGALTWSIASGALPAGVTLNTATGALTGAPTTSGAASFVLQVTDANAVQATQALNLTVNPQPAIFTTILPDAVVTRAFSQSLTATGGTGTLTWSLTAGALPAGLTLSTAGLISGTPTAAGPASFTVQAQDSLSIAATKPLSIQVLTLPSITTSTLPALTVGQSVSATLTASSGTPPYTWSIQTGALPAGLTLNANTGALTGTVASPGTASFTATFTATFTAKVIDSHDLDSTASLSWLVNAAPAITTTTLSPTTVTAAYSATPAATGGTGALTWSILAGALPPGLAVNAATGALTGTPSAPGPASFTLRVTDTNNVSADQPLSLTVNPQPTINTTALPQGFVTSAYSQLLSATGGTGALTWTMASGALPPGLTLSPAGLLGGTPAEPGTYHFTARVQDSLNVATTQTLSLRILTLPSVSTTSLPPATVGKAVSVNLAAASGTPPYRWAVAAGALPTGVSLDGATGALTGTPSTPGVFPFTAKVTDSANQEATAQLSWTVNAALLITTVSIPETTLTRPLAATTLTASGGTGALSWTAPLLPAGLSLSATGTLSGTPALAATTGVEFRVTDANGASAARTLPLTVNPEPLITTTSLPKGVVTVAYSHALASSGGTGAKTFSLASGALPAGLMLSNAGLLSGVPTSGGAATFSLRVTDSVGATATSPLTLLITEAPVIVTSTLPALTVGQKVSVTLAAEKGTAPYVWSLAAGALPAGLQLAASGLISGAASDAVSASFTLQVRDSQGLEASRSFTWKATAGLSITVPTPQPLISGRPMSPQSITVRGGTPPVSFSVQGLPPGLTLNESTGEFSGVPAAPGSFDLTVTARDSGGVTATTPSFWRVVPGLSITTTSLAPATAGRQCLRPIAISGGTAPLEWFITPGALPPGLIASATNGTLSGLPTQSGAFQFGLLVRDANGVEASQAFALQINPELNITATPLPTATSGQSLNHLFASIGGTAPLVWSLADGSLPAGVNLTSQGELLGIVSSSGDFPFTVRVRDTNGAEATRALSLHVNPANELRLSPATLRFESFAGGPAPAPRQVTVSSTPSHYAVRISSSAPWLSAALTSAQTPLVLNVTVTPAALPAGLYTALLTVEGPETRTVAVEWALAEAPTPRLSTAPAALTFHAKAGATPAQALLRLSSTASTPPWIASSDASWLTVSPPQGVFDADHGATLTVTADPAALPASVTSATLTIRQGEALLEVPVTLRVEELFSFELSYTGLNFEWRTGASPEPQPLLILNRAASPLTWSALATEPWIRLDAATGTADPVSTLSVQLDTTGLTPGAYNGRIIVAPPSGELARTADVRLTVSPRGLPPSVSPAGLLFLSLPERAAERQFIRLVNPGSEPVSFTAASAPVEAGWVSLSQTSGLIAGGAALDLAVHPAPGQLTPGIHRAQVTVEFSDGTVRVVTLALRVVAVDCSSGSPELSWVRLGEHFSVPAGQPAAIAVSVTDGCGQPVSSGAGLVTFSADGEPALTLVPGPFGLWTATWLPTVPTTSLSLNVLIQNERGLSGALSATGRVTAQTP